MYNKQAFENGYRGGCGSIGRGKMGGPWGRGKFGGFWGGPAFGRHMARFNQPPVNIEETNTEYTISLYAAGLDKNKVTLTVKDDVLRIAYPGANTEASQGVDSSEKGNFTYQEYSQGAFERAFQLNNKVLTESISASYADGILKVTLPKDPTTNVPAQTITVA